MSKLNVKKSSGYDWINAINIKSLPPKALIWLTLIFNGMPILSHFPTQWKCAEIATVAKLKKSENVVSSYRRTICLLITFSKIFEETYLNRLLPVLEEKIITPDH